jgi:hypothetical protein
MANNPHVAVPWGSISQSPTLFLHTKYQPVTVEIREPSKMTGMQAQALFHHWEKRQAKGKVVFRFKKVDQTHVRETFGPQRQPDAQKEEEREESLDLDHLIKMDDEDESDNEDLDLTWR